MPLVLGPLLTLSALLTALGLITLAVIIVAALFQVADTTVGWIPWLGKKASGGLRATEKRLNSRLSAAAMGLQGDITATWHVLAYLIEQTGEAIWEATQVGAHVMWLVRVKYPLDVISFLAHKGAAAAQFAGKVRTGDIKNYYTQKGISAKQWRDVVLKLTTLGAAVALLRAAQAHAPSLPQTYVPSLPQSLKGIRSRLGKLEARFGRTAFAALVAGALATLGLSWIRRSCAKRTSESFCRADSALLDVLTYGMIATTGVLSFRQFVEAAQFVEEEVVNAIAWTVPELSEVIAAAHEATK